MRISGISISLINKVGEWRKLGDYKSANLIQTKASYVNSDTFGHLFKIQKILRTNFFGGKKTGDFLDDGHSTLYFGISTAFPEDFFFNVFIIEKLIPQYFHSNSRNEISVISVFCVPETWIVPVIALHIYNSYAPENTK